MRAVSTDWVEVGKGIVTIVSSTEPESLTITGADVEGLPDDCVIAAGSVIVTPDKNYIAFTDGTFTEKSSSGGGGGGSTIADQVYPFGATVTFNVSGLPSGEWRKFCDGDATAYCPIYFQLYEGGDWYMSTEVVLANGTTEAIILSSDPESASLDLGETLPAWTMTLDDNAEVVDDEGWYLLKITGDTTIGLVPT